MSLWFLAPAAISPPHSSEAIRPRSGRSGPGDNALDDPSLCLGVVLHSGPVLLRKLALGLGVELALFFILAQAVAQQ